MVKLVVSSSDKKDKRFKAVFTYDGGKTRTTHFGLKNPRLFILLSAMGGQNKP